MDSVKELSKDINKNYSTENVEDDVENVPDIKAILCPIGVDGKPFIIRGIVANMGVKVGRNSSCEVYLLYHTFFPDFSSLFS